MNDADGDGYGTDGYGEGGYGNNNDDPPMTDIDFNDAINRRIDQRIDQRLEEYEPPDTDNDSGSGDGGVTESRVLELIDRALEERDSGGGSDTDTNSDPELAQRLDRLEQRLDRLNPEQVDELFGRLDSGLDRFEQSMGLRATIGPAVPDDAKPHSTPGWGLVFEADGPLRFGECQVVSNQPGETVVELHRYEGGDSQGRVDSTRLSLPVGGEQGVDLDIHVPEAGTYLLTRDYTALEEGELAPDDRVALWRTYDNWDGWGEVANGLLDLISSAHPDFGSEPELWYYYFEADVQAAQQSEE